MFILKNGFRQLTHNYPELEAVESSTGNITIGKLSINSLDTLSQHLASIYSDAISYEISHIEGPEERHWLYQTIENLSSLQPAPALLRHMSRLLIHSEVFDHFMAKRFAQVKRYGLEGCESMIIAIDLIMQLCKAEHLVFGMAHRGRINLMIGLLGYPPQAVFHKLSGNSELPKEWSGTADVLSHLCITHGILHYC